MRILGIETSCDETAAAVVEDGHKLLSNVIASSVDMHIAYGGVVPEIAARSHIESIIPVIEQALTDAFQAQSLKLKAKNLSAKDFQLSAGFDPWDQIDAIAVTQGPGLIGSLLVGVLTARTLAIAKQKPLFAINHVHAHPYAAFLTAASKPLMLQGLSLQQEQPEFPMLALIVSGGHTQLVLFESHKKYQMLGQTTDDAVGEAYDKVAKMLGLPYPGGPSVDKAAQKGDPNTFNFPIAKFDVKGPSFHTNAYPFSFSGLKTAVLRAAQSASGHDYTFPSSALPEALTEPQKANIAASFQDTAVKTLLDKLELAAKQYKPKSIVIAGGVAANLELRKQLEKRFPQTTHTKHALRLDAMQGADEQRTKPYGQYGEGAAESATPQSAKSARGADSLASGQSGTTPGLFFPDIRLCTDNAAMVATLAYYQSLYAKPGDPYTLGVDPGLKM